ncbi:class I SAM-dependent methyltransferase [Haloplanus sp. GCM10025708]|uniref:class I SAM-dependent methyltransferase n=1 Tax=Haloplanus sp. GCM10025708 TaxID=3252679 RepID=UPI0036228738
MLDELPPEPRILEAGVGTGAMVARLVEWGVAGTYRGVDRSREVLARARDGRAAELDADPVEGGFDLDALDVRFERGDALSAFDGERADLLVASSFLDLVPITDALDAFEAALRPGGLVYAPFTFDGATVFQPDHPADAAVEAAYHDHIDGQPGRDARAGRHLLDHLRERGGDLLSIASSDWVVRPRDGSYPAREAAFLAAILEFVADAVERGSTGNASKSGDLDRPDADDWLRKRRRQLETGELSYVAHQYDFLYRTPEP